MNFASDNCYGVAKPIMEAIEAANKGAAGSYSSDDLTAQLQTRFSEVFERQVSVMMVVTGTAANALAVSSFTPPYGAIFCHEESHLNYDECGASEFYSGGAKLVTLPGDGGKISPADLSRAVGSLTAGNEHHVQPAVFSLTNATEAGRVYSVTEVKALADVAHSYNLTVHMDGARFANALCSTGATPAEMTWKAGVDVMSFGATKNGAMAAEAILFFDGKEHKDTAYRRMRGGHLISKSRFIAAQFFAYLTDNLWMELAAHANQHATMLANGLEKLDGPRLAWPVEANEVFVTLPKKIHERLLAAGAVYHPWPGAGPQGDRSPGDRTPGDDEILVRFVTSFATTKQDVVDFLGLFTHELQL